MPRNVLKSILNDSSDHYVNAAKKLHKLVDTYLSQGKTPDQAVRLAWPDSGFDAASMSDDMVETMGKAISKGMNVDVEITKEFKDWALDKYVTAGDMTLSEQIYENAASNRTQIIDTLQTQLRQNKSINSMAKSITDADIVKGDVAQKISSLADYSRKAFAGDPEAIKEYKKAIVEAQDYIVKMAESSPNADAKLLKAYQRVIDATEKGTQQAMDKALQKAIDAKARYNAERLVRTETSKAYGLAVKQKILNDQDAVGMRSEVSSVHDENQDYDICDFYAEADLYGLGAGCYPKDSVPDYPYHANCMCILTPIYEGEVLDDNDEDENAQDLIDDLSEDEKESLMGVQGAQDYNDNPDSWREQVGISDEQPMKNVIPIEED